MKEKINIAVLVPCYNEELTIGKVVKDFKVALPKAKIYVCDNNSTDNTTAEAINHGAEVIYEAKKGKANAVFKLFEKVNADVYVMIDGDDTYPAESAQKLIDTLINEDLDMVVGDRLSNKSYFKENKRAFHSFGNVLTRRMINSFFNSSQTDILSGYRVFSNRFVKNYTSLIQGFELETDLTLFCLNYNLVAKEIPIDYRDRPENSTSKLNTYKDGYRIITTIFNLYRFYKPLSFFSWAALLFLLAGCLFGFLPVYEYIVYDYVYKVPTFILSVFLILIAILLFVTGLMLDSIMKIDRKSIILKIREIK